MIIHELFQILQPLLHQQMSEASITTHTICTVKGFFTFAALADLVPTVPTDSPLLPGVSVTSTEVSLVFTGLSLVFAGEAPVLLSLPPPPFTTSVNAGVGHLVCHSL
jgi:hypothetical protein